MLDLILIILLIISISKPDVLLAKKVREKASEEQKSVLVKNLRKIYGIFIAAVETGALCRYVEGGFLIALIAAEIAIIVLFFIFALPGIKQNRQILKELK